MIKNIKNQKKYTETVYRCHISTFIGESVLVILRPNDALLHLDPATGTKNTKAKQASSKTNTRLIKSRISRGIPRIKIINPRTMMMIIQELC